MISRCIAKFHDMPRDKRKKIIGMIYKRCLQMLVSSKKRIKGNDYGVYTNEFVLW